MSLVHISILSESDCGILQTKIDNSSCSVENKIHPQKLIQYRIHYSINETMVPLSPETCISDRPTTGSRICTETIDVNKIILSNQLI